MLQLQATDRVRSANPAFAFSAGAAELTVVIPTLNERSNVEPLVRRLELALLGVSWQAVFVDDDSADGTADAVKAIAQIDPRIFCLHRIGRTGLAGAAIEGVLASSAPYVAVIDGDLQHDERLLPKMLELMRGGRFDLVVASRYLGGAAVASGFSPLRRRISRLAKDLGAGVLGDAISDPVSGFFMARRSLVTAVAPSLWPSGFKILFDLAARHNGKIRITELSYNFRARRDGRSKFNLSAAVDYGLLVFARGTGLDLPLHELKAWAAAAAGFAMHGAAFGVGAGFLGARAELLAAPVGLAGVAGICLLAGGRPPRGTRASSIGLAVLGALGMVADLAVARWVVQLTGQMWIAALAGGLASAVWFGLMLAARRGRS